MHLYHSLHHPSQVKHENIQERLRARLSQICCWTSSPPSHQLFVFPLLMLRAFRAYPLGTNPTTPLSPATAAAAPRVVRWEAAGRSGKQRWVGVAFLHPGIYRRWHRAWSLTACAAAVAHRSVLALPSLHLFLASCVSSDQQMQGYWGSFATVIMARSYARFSRFLFCLFPCFFSFTTYPDSKWRGAGFRGAFLL